jgi:ribosomal protein S18 acetylase RimI-like enzyme
VHIRRFNDSDLAQLIEITISTFRPFHEGYARPLFGDELFRHQHGNWEQGYRDELPTLHDPAAGKFIAVAEFDDHVAGLVAWNVNLERKHGEIYLLAVSATDRRSRAGSDLCSHAMAEMRSAGVVAVQIGTGGDPFHAPARGLYESLGFTKIPTAAYLRLL